jgi:hypothetical protein
MGPKAPRKRRLLSASKALGLIAHKRSLKASDILNFIKRETLAILCISLVSSPYELLHMSLFDPALNCSKKPPMLRRNAHSCWRSGLWLMSVVEETLSSFIKRRKEKKKREKGGRL